MYGYAGTSAGSIVATLAAVGYTADEMADIMCRQVDFEDFLDDRGALLRSFSELLQSPGLWGVVERWWEDVACGAEFAAWLSQCGSL